MRRVRADGLCPGMVLAEPLKDLAGRTLLKEGAELTETYIQRIRQWGFESLAVRGGDNEPEPLPPVVGWPVEGLSWDQIRDRIELRFSRSPETPILRLMKRAILGRVRELVEGYGRR